MQHPPSCEPASLGTSPIKPSSQRGRAATSPLDRMPAYSFFLGDLLPLMVISSAIQMPLSMVVQEMAVMGVG